MINGIEEALAVRIHDPAHFSLRDPDPHRIQRMMLAASGTKSVAESGEVRFKDGLQHPTHRQLDDFVFHSSNAERPFGAVGFGYP